MKKIKLPYGGEKAAFTIKELKDYFKKNKLAFMVIGQSHLSFENHPKSHSLDYWFRKHKSVSNRDTCQAVKFVTDQLEFSKNFNVEKRACPKTKRLCNALVLKK